MEALSERVIDSMFKDIPNFLVSHQTSSFNDFIRNGIPNMLRENSPITLLKDETDSGHNLVVNIYLGGKEGDKVYYGSPVIADSTRDHYMFPNVARLRNMTYAMTIHYDVYLEFFLKTDEALTYLKDGATIPEGTPTITKTIEKVFLGRFPIMLLSESCLLSGLASDVRFELGECKHDHGGYFIIDGKEKVILTQEVFAANQLYLRDNLDRPYSCSAEIRSESEDASKPVRTVGVKLVAEGGIISAGKPLSCGQLVVTLPNVRKPIPLFIVMRALGVISDKEIIRFCIIDFEKYASYVDLFIPSVHDSRGIYTQPLALKYIASFTKYKTTNHALDILTNYFLPHIGDVNFIEKAYFLGLMSFNVLGLSQGQIRPTDRDSFRFKRLETPGMLLSSLFREYLALEKKAIYQRIDKEYTYKESIYSKNFVGLIMSNYREFFSDRVIESGFKKAFKGNWGSNANTKRLGIVQSLNRLSYNSALSHLRKVILPLDDSAKVVKPRLLHGSQWCFIDPVDTPDGGNVGLHKHLAISAQITTGIPKQLFIDWLLEFNLKPLSTCEPQYLVGRTIVILNGAWIGVHDDPQTLSQLVRTARRRGSIPSEVSCYWNIEKDIIYLQCDSGRLIRPVYYIDTDSNEPSYELSNWLDRTNFTWNELVNKSTDIKFCTELGETSALVEYIDTSEEEGTMISASINKATKKKLTHIEIHPSFLLGAMGNQVVYPSNNPLARNLFACGQMKQAISLYHSNYQNRIDKMGVILNSGQTPLVKSRYLWHINKDSHPYGENVMCAIMCYGGYNVEDSILFNKGSLDRGMFRTTYFNSYEAMEESSSVGDSISDVSFANIEEEGPTKMKLGKDYSLLDERGVIIPESIATEDTILIGKVSRTAGVEGSIDSSVSAKKGQKGIVDKVVITEGEEGFRVAKVRIRDERVPAIGDKFCSRCGQKGTIGQIIPEENMPFTENGIRPDIIINPHALPSRMTIGQLIEALMGKACTILGGFGDCTAFVNKGEKAKSFGKILTELGYSASGNELFYNGESGETISAPVYIGPTYYMRLKHMVKDKINHRARGPRTTLTRQTLQGRANEGGLRIGEMERDTIAAHGAMHFLQESLMVRGDQYYMAICNQSGMIAVYNQTKNIFLSPMIDGPLRFNKDVEGNLNVINVSRFGRNFSIVRIPYAFKLLMQELTTMNIQMRLLTEDNIDQLSCLKFSDNTIDSKKFEKEKLRQDRERGWKFVGNSPGKGDTYHSILRNEIGEPTEVWHTGERNNKLPDKVPEGWKNLNKKDLDKDLLETLLTIDAGPNNWDRVTQKLMGSDSERKEDNTRRQDRLPDLKANLSTKAAAGPNVEELDLSHLSLSKSNKDEESTPGVDGSVDTSRTIAPAQPSSPAQTISTIPLTIKVETPTTSFQSAPSSKDDVIPAEEKEERDEKEESKENKENQTDDAESESDEGGEKKKVKIETSSLQETNKK